MTRGPRCTTGSETVSETRDPSLLTAAQVISIFMYRSILARTTEDPAMLMVPSVLNAVQVTVFSAIYKFVGQKLTEFENHRTVHEHNSALFGKLTVFYFINNFATLFYIAFFKGFTGEGCTNPIDSSDSCSFELSTQVAIVFVVNDTMVRLHRSVVVPSVNRLRKAAVALRSRTIDAKNMGAVEKQFVFMSQYEPNRELVLDYIEL